MNPVVRASKKPFSILIVALLFILAIISVTAYTTMDYVENDPSFCRTCHLMEKAWNRWDNTKHSEVNCHECHKQSMTQNMIQLYRFIVLRPKEITKHAEVESKYCEECHYANDPRWPFVKETVGHKKHVEELEKECMECHGEKIHRFDPVSTLCDKCHDVEFRIGKMQFHCLTCHEFLASEEETTTLLPRRKECLLCHEEKEAPILSITPQAHRESDCKLCHRPHERDKPLSCKECHVTPNTTLHMIGAHGDCTSCHVVHIRKEARDVCLACHPDKKDHHSSISDCTKCHDQK